MLDDVGCDGTETRLEDCPKAQMSAECTHTQDAGVSCECEWARSYVTLHAGFKVGVAYRNVGMQCRPCD